MKMTVVTTNEGALVAASYGHTPQPNGDGTPSSNTDFRAGLLAGHGQQLHVLDVSDDFCQITSPKEFQTRIESEVRQKRK